MRALVICILLLALGCAGNTITVYDQDGKATAEFEQRFGGRGCIAATADGSGAVDVIVQQDGSTDWAGIRALPSLAQLALSAVFGSRGGDPVGFDGPSGIAGCAGLFVDLDEEPEAEVTVRGVQVE